MSGRYATHTHTYAREGGCIRQGEGDVEGEEVVEDDEADGLPVDGGLVVPCGPKGEHAHGRQATGGGGGVWWGGRPRTHGVVRDWIARVSQIRSVCIIA